MDLDTSNENMTLHSDSMETLEDQDPEGEDQNHNQEYIGKTKMRPKNQKKDKRIAHADRESPILCPAVHRREHHTERA